jgi:DNA primase (bacterial type)
MVTLTKEELQMFRDIEIAEILKVPRGRRVMLRCPFHNERTPSFLLDERNGYYCFGCGKKGSGALDFCRDMGYTFRESLEQLAIYLKV